MCGRCVWGSMLAITWTREVISCRVNCCRRPVFKKNLVLTSLLTAVVLRPPQTPPRANSIFLQHRHWRLADANSPMFQQAPMSPIFDVRCVHRPNPNRIRRTWPMCRYADAVTSVGGRDECRLLAGNSEIGRSSSPSLF